jgi:hypothetical protein
VQRVRKISEPTVSTADVKMVPGLISRLQQFRLLFSLGPLDCQSMDGTDRAPSPAACSQQLDPHALPTGTEKNGQHNSQGWNCTILLPVQYDVLMSRRRSNAIGSSQTGVLTDAQREPRVRHFKTTFNLRLDFPCCAISTSVCFERSTTKSTKNALFMQAWQNASPRL